MVSVPIELFPLALPFTSHVTPPTVPLTVAVKTCELPRLTVAAAGLIATLTGLGGVAVMLIVAVAALLGSASLRACTVTLSGFAIVCGAMNSPLAEIVPSAAVPPAIPFTLHVTDFDGLPALEITAVNCCCPPATTVSFAGETKIPTSLVMVMDAVPLFVGSLTLVAATTSALCGSTCGATYIPLDETVPSAGFPPGIPSTLHITAEFVAFDTVAENCIPMPINTVPVGGETLTPTAAG